MKLIDLTGPFEGWGPVCAPLIRLDDLCFSGQAWGATQWQLFSLSACRTLTAWQQDDLCGFLVYQDLGFGEAELVKIGVPPPWRRCGIALALLERLERSLSPKGRIFLEVRVSNQEATKLYTQAGFIAIGVRKDYYSSPKENSLLFEKQR